jgi:predicted RecB family nuclease
MQRRTDGHLLFSASDLVNFLGCEHATMLDLANLDAPQCFEDDSEETQLLQRLGIAHEIAYLERLKGEGKVVAEIPADLDLAERVERTLLAMRDGVEVIYQGALIDVPWHGYSDFLIKVEGVQSQLGSFVYEVADTKLARTAKPKHIIQLCVYADLLAVIQGIDPPNLHVVLGDGSVATVTTANVRHYYATARERFRAFADDGRSATSAEPCGHCTFCRWAPTCESHWGEIDHLSQVANISRSQIAKLAAAGIDTLAALATSDESTPVADLNPAQFRKLRAQARLQLAKRTTGENAHEVLASDPPRGFDRLPRPDNGDIFFDMEGDPHQQGGLEYLFGVVVIEAGRPVFTPFWGHDRACEKQAFEACVDFMTERLRQSPCAHIYHYGSYEETALKRLAMIHGTRENEVDDLLRREKLVDLFQVVREGVRVSEPRYSIKNLEAFYRAAKREGEVTTAGASIVMYERWRRTGETKILDDIANDNEDDCVSTWECRDA